MARATNTGVNMDSLNNQNNLRLPLREYVQGKYEGLEPRILRVILHPHYQINMQKGTKT